jgi:RNA 2',3'-cyclic 3'-phosphodiesterase
VRTFLAIELDDAIRQRLAAVQERLRSQAGGVKWVEPANIHLTLKFLGEIEEDVAALVAEALAPVAAGIEPFEMRAAGIGSFPPHGAPRVVWVGIQETTGRLLELHRRVERELEALDIEREDRPFAAHVTLGRVKDRPDPRLRHALDARAAEDFGTQPVTHVTFFQSILSPAGPTYTALHRLKLGQAAAPQSRSEG